VKAFTVSEGSPGDFVVRVQGEIKSRQFEDIASVRLEGGVLVVTFSWMGKTSLKYRLQPQTRGFSAVLERQKVSPFHAPFKAGFEERFDQIIAKVGARSLKSDSTQGDKKAISR